MAVDFSRYLPPGIYTNPQPGPLLVVNSSLPAAVGLIGMSLGYRSAIQSLLVNPDSNETTGSLSQNLAHQGIHTDSIVVINPNSGAVYSGGVGEPQTDYLIENTGGLDQSSNALYAIRRVVGGHIEPGDYIQITYRYTDPHYFDAFLFFDYNDVQAAYGAPFNLSTGEIQSELTLAAKFAFLNGAYQVVCVAVDPAGAPLGSPGIGDYNEALQKLNDDPLIAVVVPCTGQQPLAQLVQEHVDAQSQNRHERRAIVALDGTVNQVSMDQRIIDAQELSDQRIMQVCPDVYEYFSPELNTTVRLGGQYMAASLAGLTVANSFAQPLTRKLPVGWHGVVENEPEGQKSYESSQGLCVVEVNYRHQIWVRHGVTTDPTDLETREWSIIGQQDAMVYRMRDYLNAANLIGQPIYPYTLTNVKSAAEAALQSLIRDGLLVDYTGLSVRQLLTNPDVVEISWGWLPAFPLNYLVLTFGINLTTGGSVATAGANAVGGRGNVTNVVSQITAPRSFEANDFGGPSNTLMTAP